MILKGGVELLNHPDVINFYNELIENYIPPKYKKIALFLPCAAKKPYSTSRTHSQIRNVISKLENIQKIHELIISEPLGIVPREWEQKYPASHYDMVLDSWFPANNIPKIRRKYGNDLVKIKKSTKNPTKQKTEIIKILSERVAKFLEKTVNKYQYRIGYVRSSHREILEKASEMTNIEIDFVFNSNFRNNIINSKGTFYWIMNGMRCTESLDLLYNKLTSHC